MGIERGEHDSNLVEFTRNDFSRSWMDTFTDVFGEAYYIQQPGEKPNASQQIAVYYLPPDPTKTDERSEETILTIVHNFASYDQFYKVDVCEVDQVGTPVVIKEVEIDRVSANLDNKSVSFHGKEDDAVLTVYSSGRIDHSASLAC